MLWFTIIFCTLFGLLAWFMGTHRADRKPKHKPLNRKAVQRQSHQP